MFSRLLSAVRVVCMTVGALLLLITFTPLVSWTARLLKPSWTDVDQGVLIVLSGSTTGYDDGSPGSHGLVIGENSYWRAVHAIYVWRHGHFRNILLSGVGTAETLKPLLIAHGIPENVILVENAATSTHENALFSKPILAGLPGPYVLLTSDYHMYRASRCFAHEQIAVETMPAPDLFKRVNAPLLRWEEFWILGSEFGKIAYYRFKGWM